MPLSLQQLQTFRAVATHGSFSAAARALFTTQPHVSNQIRSLEEHFRVPLFIRSKSSITLTEAGTALLARALTVLAELDDAERIAREFRDLRRGSVGLAVTSSFGNHLLPGIIADFRRTRPDVTVVAEVDNTDRVWELVETDRPELAITTSPPPRTRRLTAEPFVGDDLVLISPTGMRLPPVLTPAAIAQLPLVLREEGSLTLTVLRDLVHGFELTVSAQLSGTAAVNEAVAAGVGISLVPQSSVGAWQSAGTIAVHRLPGPRLRHDYVLVHSPDRFQTAAATALLAHLRDWATRHDPLRDHVRTP